MASRSSNEYLNLENADEGELWLYTFEAKARIKKIEDTNNDYCKRDYFLSLCGMTALIKIKNLVSPQKITDVSYEEIKESILNYLRPKHKITITERAKFFDEHQRPCEKEVDYLARLRDAATFCKFDEVTEEEIILLKFISGLNSSELKLKILEANQIKELNIEGTIQLIQSLGMIRSFINNHNNIANNQIENLNQKHSVEDIQAIHRSKRMIKNCSFCAGNHLQGSCPAYGKICNKCKKKNHFSKACTSKDNRSSIRHIELGNKINDEQNDDSECYHINTSKGKYQNFNIGGYQLKMQIDTGASISILPKNFWIKMGSPKLRKCNRKLTMFDGTELQVLGQFSSYIETENKFSQETFIVSKNEKSHGLIGLSVIDMNKSHLEINSLKYENLGCCLYKKAEIKLKKDTKPCYFNARELPIHLKEKVLHEIKEMEQAGVISRVKGGSEWASPIVAVHKSDGNIRLCGDYKVGVNKRVCSDSYCIPGIEMAFTKMHGFTKFAKIDLSSAYWQIPLTDESKKITTINTPFGLYAFNRLPFGIKTASSIFQETMESILEHENEIIIYQDDILLGGKDINDLQQRLQNVISKLEKNGISINYTKTVLMADELKFLGMKISRHGLSPDNTLVEKIKKMNEPTCKKEVDIFVGLINYYGRFIKNLAEILHPITELKKDNNKFYWTNIHQKSFDKLKQIISEYPIVQTYNPNKELTVSTDASENTIGSVLTQEDHPVIYLSRKLTSNERNYSTIEKEALAIVWTLKRAKNFLLGRHFKLKCDHQPLKFLFDCNKELPKFTSARIQRWAIELMAFDYEIEFVPGKTHKAADAMTRLNFESDEFIDNDENINILHWENNLISLNTIKEETKHDVTLQGIYQRILKNKWNNCSQKEKPFKQIRQTLCIQDGIIVKENVPVIPSSLRKSIIQTVHSTHMGIKATKHLIKLEAWWPGCANDVERFIRECDVCNESKPKIQKELNHWPVEEKPWSRIHIDHAFLDEFGSHLIIVDSFSGWPEIIKVSSRSVESTIDALRCVFSRLGVPNYVVSDNAAEFCSNEFYEWLKKIGCTPIKAPPYHPQSNGTAERMVRSIKTILNTWRKELGPFKSYLQKALMQYRAIPHGERSTSASQLMGRQLRVPILYSNTFMIGENVLFGNENKKGIYIMQKGTNTGIIKLHEQKKAMLAHHDQLKHDYQEPKQEIIEEDEDSEATNLSNNSIPRRSPRNPVPKRFNDFIYF